MPPTISEENYIEIEIEIPLVQTRSSPLTGNAGVFNAFFNPNQTTATTNTVHFNWILSTIPSGSRVSRVEVASVRTNVAGMSYFVQIGRGPNVNSITYAPNIPWAATVSTNFFNTQDPSAIWALRFYATRVIVPPDFGAGATVTSATLRVYYT